MSKLSRVYINKPSHVLVQLFIWQAPRIILKVTGAYGSIYTILAEGVALVFPNALRFFVKFNPTKKDAKKFLGLFFSVILASLQDISLSYKIYLEMRGIGFKFFRAGAQLLLDVGCSHTVPLIISTNIFLRVLNKKNTKIMIRTFHRQLGFEFAHKIQSIRFPNEYTGKGIHFRNVRVTKKPGKQAQQK